MTSAEQDHKRKRSDDDEEVEKSNSSSDEEFEVPKEHLKLAKKRERVLKASAVIQKSQNRTTISDVRNVVLWVLSESHGTMPKWCLIRNKNLVTGVTVIITPFIDRHTLFEHAAVAASVSHQLPYFSHCVRGSMIPMTAVSAHRYPGICPVLSTFLSSPSSNKNGQWVSNLSDNEEETSTLRAPISEYLMSEENRRVHDMPEVLVSGYAPPGFVVTHKKASKLVADVKEDEELFGMLATPSDLEWIQKDPDYSNLVGMDCEMVDTTAGKELARVSLVDHLGRVLYDSVVLPENEVTDYLTQYSGITAKMIRECRTSFKDAQKQVLSFLNEKSILVGHAIDNDLKCLRLIHDRIIDTSDIFPHPNGFPSKHSLVFLLQRVLREALDREGGHDSVDDAKASLRIAMKKMARGQDYAPAGMGASSFHPLASLVDCKTALITESEIENPGRYKLENININPDTCEGAKLRIHVLRDFQASCELNESRVEALERVDRKIREILSSADENQLVVTFSGCGDLFSFRRFENLAEKCEDETQRVDVTKMLQRAKDKAVSAFAMISTVGDLPPHIVKRL